MYWRGERLRELVDASEMSQTGFSEAIGVSRQTFVDWTTKNQIPKGNHLLKICRVLGIAPEELFKENPLAVLVPAHRAVRKQKVTPVAQEASIQLAKGYESVFSDSRPPALHFFAPGNQPESARQLGERFRQLVDIAGTSHPMTYEDAFRLANALGICLIFRTFPDVLKGYAFYTRIHGHRVVFVNRASNVLDIIFAMLHEFAHAVRDTGGEVLSEFTDEEEKFCDEVASAAQFPNVYVEEVWQALKGKRAGTKVNLLKEYAVANRHAIFGLARRIGQRRGRKLPENLGGADANLHKDFPILGDVLKRDSAREHLSFLARPCPYLIRVLKETAGGLSVRKLGELLEIESPLDAREVLQVLKEDAQVEPSM